MTSDILWFGQRLAQTSIFTIRTTIGQNKHFYDPGKGCPSKTRATMNDPEIAQMQNEPLTIRAKPPNGEKESYGTLKG